jgi:HTH-type transcriptional regulator / antitoxin HigA
MNLISTYPLRPLRNDAELNVAVEVLNGLINRGDLTEAARDYMEVLGGIVDMYEAESVVIPDVRGVELLRYLLEENGLTQASLAHLFGRESNLSEVLSGKQSLSKSHIRMFSLCFGLPADAFL